MRITWESVLRLVILEQASNISLNILQHFLPYLTLYIPDRCTVASIWIRVTVHCDICYIHRCYQPSFAAVYETVSKETSDKSEVIKFNVFNHGISYVSTCM